MIACQTKGRLRGKSLNTVRVSNARDIGCVIGGCGIRARAFSVFDKRTRAPSSPGTTSLSAVIYAMLAQPRVLSTYVCTYVHTLHSHPCAHKGAIPIRGGRPVCARRHNSHRLCQRRRWNLHQRKSDFGFLLNSFGI